jgi:hypothetical protein
MAIINPIDGDLFRAGLVEMNNGLYSLIVEETRKFLGHSIAPIDKPLLMDAVKTICSSRGHNGIAVKRKKEIELSMFIENIELMLGQADVEIRLSLPIVASVEDNGLIWNFFARKIELPPRSEVKEGELAVHFTLPDDRTVIEGKLSAGKRSFSLTN